jgi:hypothetical protein
MYDAPGEHMMLDDMSPSGFDALAAAMEDIIRDGSEAAPTVDGGRGGGG